MKRAGLVTSIGLAGAVALAGPAAASCVAPPPLAQAIDEAPAAFVGTVTATSNAGRWAAVEVTEVWAGDVAEVVEVRGGTADPPGPVGASSSVDRIYREGATYLFLPFGGTGDVFRDNACSSTIRFRPGLERFRPGDAAPRGAASDGPGEGDGSFPLWWVAAAAAGAVAGVVAWRRRAAP